MLSEIQLFVHFGLREYLEHHQSNAQVVNDFQDTVGRIFEKGVLEGPIPGRPVRYESVHMRDQKNM